MADQQQLTNRVVYEARDQEGAILGALKPLDWYRFRQTLKLVPKTTRSLLDCGCDRGHWLQYILQHRRIQTHLGVDVSEARVSEARSLYPELNLSIGYLEKLDRSQGRFDVVTALEVLEHIPRWRDVLKTLLAWAEDRVIVTVPYRQTIATHACIHCGKSTPASGHLHSFSEDTFPQFAGWSRSVGYIKNRGVDATDWAHRIYAWLRPRTVWLAVVYVRVREAPHDQVDTDHEPSLDG